MDRENSATVPIQTSFSQHAMQLTPASTETATIYVNNKLILKYGIADCVIINSNNYLARLVEAGEDNYTQTRNYI